MEKQKLVVVCGPTASGKSALAVELAQQFGGEIVSADSMQVYRGMDIGTAKPTHAEMHGIPHHMLDCAEVDQEYSAALYREGARACIEDISARGALPILCGGTGLYISATVYPLDFENAEADEGYRTELTEYVKSQGNVALHRKLAELCPESAAEIHPNNVKRVIRALEKQRKIQDGVTSHPQQLFNGELLYEMAWIGLEMPRELLYRRIDARVDEMIRRGLPEEVNRLATRISRDSTAFQALGYKELLDYLDGKCSLAEAVEKIKQGTRNYAKRQMTWFRRETGIRWFDITACENSTDLKSAVAGYIRDTLHIG